VHGATQYWLLLFRNYNIKENAGAEAKPGGDIMVLQCKKGKLFVTGEVFLLDIGLLMGGLLMGAECSILERKIGATIYGIGTCAKRLGVEYYT
jgi:hypothetical protein